MGLVFRKPIRNQKSCFPYSKWQQFFDVKCACLDTHTFIWCKARTPLGPRWKHSVYPNRNPCLSYRDPCVFPSSVINTFLRGNTQVHPRTRVCTSEHTIFPRPNPTTYRIPRSTLVPGYINSTRKRGKGETRSKYWSSI